MSDRRSAESFDLAHGLATHRVRMHRVGDNRRVLPRRRVILCAALGILTGLPAWAQPTLPVVVLLATGGPSP